MADDSLDLNVLRDGVRDVLAELASSERMHKYIDRSGRFDDALWQQATELGWMQLAVPEAYGGLGLGIAELAVVYEEIGRAVAPLPFLGTQLAIDAIARAGSEAQRKTWLPRLAEGELPAAVSNLAPGASSELTAQAKGDGLVLTGRIDNLLNGAAAKLIVVAVAGSIGVRRFVLIDPDRDGVTVEFIEMRDRTRHLAALDLTGLELPLDRLLDGPDEVVDDIGAHAALGIACDALGGATAILEKTIEYLKIREQFGKPIGSFQALKHRCADHRVAIEAAGAVLADAVIHQGEGAADALMQASLAKFYACDSAAEIARDTVQLHGGIGFTWEHDCHLYLKRAKLNQALFGTSAQHMDHAARRLVA